MPLKNKLYLSNLLITPIVKYKKILVSFLLNATVMLICVAQSSLIVVKPQGTKKCGYVDLEGNFVIQPKYRLCYDIVEDGAALVAVNKKMTKFLLFDNLGNEITTEIPLKIKSEIFNLTPSIAISSVVCLKQQGNWGAVNNEGKICVPFEYNELTIFHDGYALAKKNTSCYVLNEKGVKREILAKQVTYIKPFREGLAPVEVGNQNWGFVDTTGILIIEPQFRKVGHFHEGIAWVEDKNSSATGCINNKGEWIVEPVYKKMGDFSGGHAWVRSMNNKIGFINTLGELVIDFQFNTVYNFGKESGMAMVKKNDEWMYCDTLGKLYKFEHIDKIYSYSEGLARAKKDNKIGFINNKGEWVIEPQFDVCQSFINNFAEAEINGKWGSIDHEGNWVLEPIYKQIGQPTVIDEISY